MRKLVLLVVILIMGIAFVSCQEEPQSTTSTMTAAEVVQHVNQVLKNEYIYRTLTTRYEIRYAALSAEQWEIRGQTLELVWHVTVRVTTEYQRLHEGQWILGAASPNPATEIRTYRFFEKTARLELLQN